MAMDSSVAIVGYLALFGGVGFVFVFVNLLLGRFLRPNNPHEEKLEIYECGEPAIGSSFVQFDLRFYVVALVFLIFDVEVAFLFPWATVFGKVTNLRNDGIAMTQAGEAGIELTPSARGLYTELGDATLGAATGASGTAQSGVVVPNETVLREGQFSADGVLEVAGLDQLVPFLLVAILVFFVVLLVGFAYEWRTGALDWVRAVAKPQTTPVERPAPRSSRPQESVLSA